MRGRILSDNLQLLYDRIIQFFEFIKVRRMKRLNIPPHSFSKVIFVELEKTRFCTMGTLGIWKKWV
jgi:hypothetical protein